MKLSVAKVFFIIVLLLLLSVTAVYAVNLLLKLPYKKGESFLVTQGYNTSFTHKGKDKYALDFTQSGCKAYRKPALTTAPGKISNILKVDPLNPKKGYGNAVKVNHGNNLETIYAHLRNFVVKKGQNVQRGQVVGYIGNTGFASGTACKKYPGTHLHFALYKREGSKYIGVKPEPMSGYTNFKAGKWYTSDNEIVSGEVKGAKTKKEIWNQKFISYKLSKINSQVYKVTLNFKNTGNTTWAKDKISLNVIGGYGGTAAKFYHKSWLTRLRPTLLSQNTAPGKIGAFIFYIQLPKTPGKYYPQFRPVRYLGGERFEWIGKDVGTFPIEVKKEVIPKPTCSISANPSSILKGNYSVIKWKSSNATSVSITNIGNVALSGSKKVYPLINTTYKMTAKGKGGTAICSVKVTVYLPSPPSLPPPSPPSPPPPPPPEVKCYVDDDGGAEFQRLQDAIDSEPSCDIIIVKDGTYVENVDINRSLTIQSENGPNLTTVQAADPNDCVFEITADYVNIIGFTVTGANTGICLWESNSSTLTENIILAIEVGIFLSHSDENIITKNNIDPVLYENSLMLASSSNNEIYLNNIDKKIECSSDSTDNTWNSPEITYIYNGKEYTNYYLGNYWSDYEGVDENSDGIGDTPYGINENNEDKYPLIEPFENYTFLEI